MAKRIGETCRILCAAPALIEQVDAPNTPADLANAAAVLFSGLAPTNEWLFAGKVPTRVPVTPRLRTNQIDVAIDACLAGLGFGQFLCYQVEALIAAGQLERLLTDYEPPALPIHIVYPSARLLSANLRALFEMFEMFERLEMFDK